MMEMQRLRLIDTIRGITIISMIFYHAAWDLLHYNMLVTREFLYGTGARIWQQSICWSFILLSGFCFSYGHHHVKRGLMSLGGGILISVITCIFMPSDRDIFGVLWLLGSATLLMIPVDKLIYNSGDNVKKGDAIQWKSIIGTLLSGILFFLTRNINRGYLGFGNLNLTRVSSAFYKGYVMTFLGFKDPEFYSSDYFSLFPWIFLFAVGFFIQKLTVGTKTENFLQGHGIRLFEFLGRHSFIIYMLHQVAIYAVITLLYYLTKI